jgi:hypothetical protein
VVEAVEEVEEVEAKNNHSSRGTAEVAKEVELKNRIRCSRSTVVVEGVEELDVKKGSCSARRPFSRNDIQEPLLAMESMVKCDISMAEEAEEMVGGKDNCFSQRTPSRKSVRQPASLRQRARRGNLEEIMKLREELNQFKGIDKCYG